MSKQANLTNRHTERLQAALRALFVYLLALALALPPTYVLSLVVGANVAAASTYATGNAKYQKGDFRGAETALKAALRKPLGRAEKAKTLKLLGICQYMLGDKNGAASSFKQALAAVPTLSVAASEVLDESVIGFFNAQKTAPKSAAAPRPVAPGPAAGIASGKPLKQTFLKVLSNVTTAQVSIDGIIAGGVNSLINTDPGTVQIEVTATGYIPRKINVNVAKNRENAITVNLDKPKPKPKPQPKSKPKLKPSAPAGGATVAVARPGKKPGKKSGKKGNVYAPTPGDDLFIDEAAGTGTDTGGGGGGGGGPDLAQQFEMESGGGYGAPPPGYGATPGYGAPPGYAAPTPAYGYGYAQPPPVYYAPPPQTYYTPPPPPPPPGDPYGGAYQDPAGVADPAGAAADPAGAETSSGKSSKKNEPSTLMLMGPLGLGQFMTDRPLFGLLFLGAEIGGLYYWKMQTDAATATANETTAYLQANCASSEGAPLSAEQSEKCNTFRNERQAYVDGLNSQAMMGIGAFGVLWAGGALEALMYDPPKAKKKKKKKTRYGGFSETSGKSPAFALLDEPPENQGERLPADFRWDMGVLPHSPGVGYDAESMRPEPALTLDLKWKF